MGVSGQPLRQLAGECGRLGDRRDHAEVGVLGQLRQHACRDVRGGGQLRPHRRIGMLLQGAYPRLGRAGLVQHRQHHRGNTGIDLGGGQQPPTHQTDRRVRATADGQPPDLRRAQVVPVGQIRHNSASAAAVNSSSRSTGKPGSPLARTAPANAPTPSSSCCTSDRNRTEQHAQQSPTPSTHL